ncbi:hypothetical protein K9U39_04295 [Rhodoblastus acidophilus]|uniref:Uncharacterized protein n=1 Tax=Candidatus Rhodoblastus alkanivorans TaxID=2954117 RepID=A0ABS9Z629_9HYPH|nr:hypothetical protein [Candidatus Rhodoblastus alkanivorans]MCI4678462.1 hypothetical protein [Candidatus Rhodoblastus alkanivorans]MCI4682865.1 hypothetical protein [Candidatus Rhodoblastus alkanivorans]MDI4640174.1 hypothetical protein [Rhodoblastus acidophilus]
MAPSFLLSAMHRLIQAASPAHALEINREAFGRCDEVMSASAADFQEKLAAFLVRLDAAGRLRLSSDFTFDEAAQLLADGARGVNETLQPRPAATLSERYRRMCAGGALRLRGEVRGPLRK